MDISKIAVGVLAGLTAAGVVARVVLAARHQRKVDQAIAESVKFLDKNPTETLTITIR